LDGIVSLDHRFAHYVRSNAPLEELAAGFRWIEGLVWFADGDYLLFQDLPRNQTLRWIEGAGVSVFRAPSHFGNGQTRDRQGRLISCSHRERCLFRTELDGAIVCLIDRHQGRRLNSPNDVIVRSDDSVWFTDPLYGIQSDYEGGRQTSEQRAAVYRFDAHRGELRIVADDFAGPNGLAFSPDESRLYVSETGDQTQDEPRQYVRVFDVDAHGSLSGGEMFYKADAGYVDGMRTDEYGNVWAAAGDGVHCVAPDGRLIGKILVPHVVSNIAFGGPARSRLFIGGSHTLYSIFLNCRGAGWP
jgi:gluconolactonase